MLRLRQAAERRDCQGRAGDAGDTWTWTALDADHKLIISYLVGGRDGGLRQRVHAGRGGSPRNRVQITTTATSAYLDAVEGAFGADIDYAMLVKIYGEPTGSARPLQPGRVRWSREARVEGRPDPKHISTSYAERQNLTMRMQMRRFTRLTNAFSKKAENHYHMVCL